LPQNYTDEHGLKQLHWNENKLSVRVRSCKSVAYTITITGRITGRAPVCF
jgi:hypothetical protein